ncbi:tyrosine-type recombinase/integrase [Kyrpidia tusciae]|uniref:Integrase family protein n=1 Tax=Kyrpidia tusciae (strain DSM 2912 / NBRC 15312 / T2) TaxID=562970 RepID=D5WUE5_KYRT2|nr:tyrosine-type recombinase/integrase [Kyrpidia tusciae]ADG07397.1 integrase family protein [Kyrpidia tusciae DSM 2912]
MATNDGFMSVLGPILEALIAEKRSVGYHYDKEVRDFARFDRFCSAVGHQSLSLPRELVEQWTAKQIHETETNRQHRISRMRVLGGYMQRCGYPAWVYPRQTAAQTSLRYAPYIFSRSELAALFRAIDTCPPERHSPYRHVVFPLLFRLLYSSGLRIGEALALRGGDVNLQTGTLHIRVAKLDKERRIPVHPALVQRMERYVKVLGITPTLEAPLFPGPSGQSYCESTIYDAFRRFLWEANISHGGRGRGPRLHDLRHTFAVHCLRKWVLEGVDLTVALPYLSAYMGHTSLKSTQMYLRLTAEVYPTVVAAVERRYASIIPTGGERG